MEMFSCKVMMKAVFKICLVIIRMPSKSKAKFNISFEAKWLHQWQVSPGIQAVNL